jgi:hypothetical protein
MSGGAAGPVGRKLRVGPVPFATSKNINNGV